MVDGRKVLGAAGEQAAERLLRRWCYAILERNYRCPLGEVDLIALDGATVVFVEVKTRTHGAYGSPFDAVDARKQRQIVRVAEYYIAEHRLEGRDARFDVVGVWPETDGLACELIKNAFGA